MCANRNIAILKYAGNDATAAYDEIHAPAILEESLAPNSYKGLLDQADIIDLPQNRKDDIKEIETSTGQTPLPQRYKKPELYKLISLHDFEDVARETLTKKAWAFYSSAATDLVTHHANLNFYRRVMLRPRVMRSVTEARMRRSILGFPSEAPFFVSPAAMARLAHKDGELALARGCASEGIIQCVSKAFHVALQATINEVLRRSQAMLPIHSLASSKPVAQIRHSSSSYTSTPTERRRHSYFTKHAIWA